MQDFRKLRVWHRAMDLAVDAHDTSRRFPTDQRYGLSSQLQRAAASVAANIAEGCGRRLDRDFIRFLRIAYGSACEVETHARIAIRTSAGDTDELQSLVSQADEIRKMLNGLIASINTSNPVSPKNGRR